ncbi:MAG: hypothetical protein OXU79_09205 [Gemmatimonadota bacterium]|nr:hypothetical protein [Gemmatimonadota bacterium]
MNGDIFPGRDTKPRLQSDFINGLLDHRPGATKHRMRWHCKLKQFQEDGPEKLLVVSDWDRTLTRSTAEDGSDQSTCSVIANSGLLGPAFSRRYRELFNRYRRIERAPELSDRAKSRHLRRWWSLQFDLLLDCKFNKRTIRRIVSERRPHLRDGARLFFGILRECRIPLIILSAGIGEIIEARLEEEGISTDNIAIVSNTLTFDPDGIAVAYQTPLIHSLNKHARHVAFIPAPAGRRNLLLLGDTLEDTRMAEQIRHTLLLSFAFPADANHLQVFQTEYDVVLAPETSLEPVNDVLADICAASRNIEP